MMNCPKCGTENSDELIFCKKCGAGLKGGPDAVTVANMNSVSSMSSLSYNQSIRDNVGSCDEQAASAENMNINLNRIDFSSQNTHYNTNTSFYNTNCLNSVNEDECTGIIRRFFALLIDYIVMGLLFWCISSLFSIQAPAISTNSSDMILYEFRQYIMIDVIALIIALVYSTLMECSPLKATLGKIVLNCMVTDLYGRRISFWHAAGRNLLKFVVTVFVNSLLLIVLSPLIIIVLRFSRFLGLLLFFYVFLFMSYSLAIFTHKKQALHDLIAGTVVIHR